jgi:ABC-type transport system involved in multi-copper enzyme maturation permease subunit
VIGRIHAIALNTFREAVRHRILYGVVAVVFLLDLFSIAMGALSFNEEARVTRDVAVSGVALFGSITAIYLGVSLLYGEIQRRTIYPIIAKPIERWEFVLGKYLGMTATLTVLVAIFAASTQLLFLLQGVAWTASVTKALVLAYAEVLVVAAIALFFSSFATPFLSGVFTAALFLFGRVTPEMRVAAETADSRWMRSIAEVAEKVIPDLHLFKVSGTEVAGAHVSIHSSFVDWSYVGTALGHGLCWIVALIVLSVVIFQRRNFV